MDILLEKLNSSELRTTVKKLRIDKWHVMVSYGLDADIAHKVFKYRSKAEEAECKNRKINKFNHGTAFNTDHKLLKHFEFTNFAIIGLSNFFHTNPELLLNRLAKGPPPQYRWLAWKFVALKLKPKIAGDYEKYLKMALDPSNE